MPASRSVCLNSLEVGETAWLWPRFIPRGCLVAFDGDPECGKSMITIDLAARLSRGPGETFPDGTPLPVNRPMRTLLLNAEDKFNDTVLPRLRAAGANLEHIFTMRSESGRVGGRAMRLPNDVRAVARLIRKEGIDLAVIDPLVAFLHERISLNADQPVRRALQPLADVMAETCASAILIRHLTKTSTQKALYRGSGSIGVIGAARAALLATRHPHRDGCCILSVNKLNLGDKPTALIYRIVPGNAVPPTLSAEPAEAGEREKTADLLSLPPLRGEGREGGSVGHVEWLGAEELTADAALNPGRVEAPGIFRALGWLQNALRDGPRLASEVILEATAVGISEHTLERAKKLAGARSEFRRNNGERTWIWIPKNWQDPGDLELDRQLGLLPPELEEADAELQSQLTDAGRNVLKREKLQWCEDVLKQAAKQKTLDEETTCRKPRPRRNRKQAPESNKEHQ